MRSAALFPRLFVTSACRFAQLWRPSLAAGSSESTKILTRVSTLRRSTSRLRERMKSSKSQDAHHG